MIGAGGGDREAGLDSGDALDDGWTRRFRVKISITELQQDDLVNGSIREGLSDKDKSREYGYSKRGQGEEGEVRFQGGREFAFERFVR